MTWIEAHAAAWNAQYAAGRYLDQEPEPFVADVIRCAADQRLASGLYIGCGNGRNMSALLEADLDLVGIDISPVAIRQIVSARPADARRFRIGDLAILSDDETFDIVIGIQVFMFGTRQQAHEHVIAAMARVNPGGILCFRANAVGTDVWPAHDLGPSHADGSFTVRYVDGPKAGLDVHFFSADELATLFAGWEELLPLRVDSRLRSNGHGQWSQFEAIWRRPN
ncbi:class I SAM-dependent methyltransferase [Plantibacter sp. YIM 135249]|uniref:class I SAM-dependent methyltransferase n=1 Tax=Plantibacter sp. YIM 135249 TaxID=3423918 RepID=UPI003D327E7A